MLVMVYRSKILLFTFSVALLTSLNCQASSYNFKGQASLFSSFSSIYNEWEGAGSIRYIPELSYEKELTDSSVLILDSSMNIFTSANGHIGSSETSRAELYRLKAELKFPTSDFRIGLQKLNFGPAVILRSLQWFDQVSSTDPLGLTNGVWAARYRNFFKNNAALWLWGLYGNEGLKGLELTETRDDSIEFGGRFQYPFSFGEVALTYHQRESERVGLSGLSDQLQEKRYAIDGRFDVEIGAWFELVMIDQGIGSDNNWYNSLVLGSDYTFSIGNGLYVVLEHSHNGSSARALKIDEDSNTTAVQFDYPYGLFDSFSLMQNYSWESKSSLSFLSWQRTYDNFSINTGLFYSESSEYNIITSPLSGKGVQLVLVYNH